MKRNLIVETKKTINSSQLQELIDLVLNQETTDREQPDDYVLYGEYGTYVYTIDEDYDIILKGIK